MHLHFWGRPMYLLPDLEKNLFVSLPVHSGPLACNCSFTSLLVYSDAIALLKTIPVGRPLQMLIFMQIPTLCALWQEHRICSGSSKIQSWLQCLLVEWFWEIYLTFTNSLSSPYWDVVSIIRYYSLSPLNSCATWIQPAFTQYQSCRLMLPHN